MKDLHYKFKKVSELCTGWISHISQTAANQKLKENLSRQGETIHYIQGNSHLNDYKTSHQKSWGWEHNRVTSKCWKEGEKKLTQNSTMEDREIKRKIWLEKTDTVGRL